jgi:diamine N-acetyltransferase
VTSAAKFREAEASDFPDLLRMMRSLAEQPPALPFDEAELRECLNEFLAHPEYGRVWLIEIDAKLGGYVILTLGYSFEYRGRDAFIDELYIEPEFRRRGYGSQAIEFAAQRVRELGVTAVHLEVDRGNEAGLALYRRAGYVDHERYLMTKWLRRATGQ